MKVRWNTNQEGFQKHWIGRYGSGPFEVVEKRDTPKEPGKIYVGPQEGYIFFDIEPGEWYYISIPKAEEKLKEYQIFEAGPFHSKWFTLEDKV